MQTIHATELANVTGGGGDAEGRAAAFARGEQVGAAIGLPIGATLGGMFLTEHGRVPGAVVGAAIGGHIGATVGGYTNQIRYELTHK